MDRRRHAVITGGGSGIGLAIAEALGASGCAVTIMGRSAVRLDAALRDLPGAGAAVCDVANPRSVDEAFDKAVGMAGPVDILVNSAGIVRTAPFARQSDADWDDMWHTNLMGSVHAIRKVIEPMRDRPAGRIINVASTASLKGYAYTSAYAASKHALLGLTRSLALELARTAITVNAVCPGYADTEIIRDAVANLVAKTGRSEDEARAQFTQTNPQKRLIDPREVAAAVVWLASDEARSITGQALAIAGGEVM